MNNTEEKYHLTFREYDTQGIENRWSWPREFNGHIYDSCTYECYFYKETCYSYKLLESDDYIYYLESPNEKQLQDFLSNLSPERLCHLKASLTISEMSYYISVLELDDNGEWKEKMRSIDCKTVEELSNLKTEFLGDWYGNEKMPTNQNTEIKVSVKYSMPTNISYLSLRDADEIDEDDDEYYYEEDDRYGPDQCWRCGATKSGLFAACPQCGEDE